MTDLVPRQPDATPAAYKESSRGTTRTVPGPTPMEDTVTQPEDDFPDCERCDDTKLDPDAYIPHQTEHGTAYRHAPCRSCQPEARENP